MLSGKDANEDKVLRHEECTCLSEELLKRLFLQVTGFTAILFEISQVPSFICFIYSEFHFPSNARMCKSTKISIALVVCWLFSTIISNFLTYTSGSITGSVEVLGETSLQSSIGAPSTAFTIWDFYTLIGPGAKSGRTVSFTAAIDYPEITTSVIFPQVFSSATLVTSPFTTLVEAVYTLVLGSVTPVGTPGLPTPNGKSSPSHNFDNFSHLQTSAYNVKKKYTCTIIFNSTVSFTQFYSRTSNQSSYLPW